MVTKLKKCSIYELWHVRKPDVIIIRGIFITLEYSEIRRYLDPVRHNVKSLVKIPPIIIFAGHSFLDHIGCLAGF